MADPSVLVVIPARGGSKGIPRKNLRSLHGRPLISYAIAAAKLSRHGPTVLVSSDDSEILSVAGALGAETHRRPDELAEDQVALDAVIHDALRAAEADGRAFDVVVTMQPTSPLITTASVDRAIDQLWADVDLDTVLSAADDTHLRWREQDGSLQPDYEARLNRQLLPKTYRETGGIFASRASVLTPTDRIGRRVGIVVLEGPEAIDIDSTEDWALCEWHLGRKDVLFVVTGNQELGLGHVHNALTVADALTRHRIRFLVDRESGLAADAIRARHHQVSVQACERLEDDVRALDPDLVINDRLDTPAEYVAAVKAGGTRVVNFEDLGAGAALADLVINAIYMEEDPPPNHYFGHRYYCPRPEFVVTTPSPIRDRVRQVLVTFGGTDPSDLTRRVVALIADRARAREIELRVILGLGYGHPTDWAAASGASVLRAVDDMAREMAAADLVITSAGRTTFEVACIGTPAIVIAQNERELTHLFATPTYGFANLGLGSELSDDQILAAFDHLVADRAARQSMHERMTAESLNGGLERVRLLIEELATA